MDYWTPDSRLYFGNCFIYSCVRRSIQPGKGETCRMVWNHWYGNRGGCDYRGTKRRAQHDVNRGNRDRCGHRCDRCQSRRDDWYASALAMGTALVCGLAAVFIGINSDMSTHDFASNAERVIHEVEIFLGVFIGAVTFTGSIIAYGKLAGKIGGKALILPGRHLLN